MRWILLMVSLVGSGCIPSRESPSSTTVTAPPEPPKVNAVSPKREKILRIVEQPGTIQAYEETVLMAKIPGYVRTLLVDIGQHVKGPRKDASGNAVEPGQILAELFVPELHEEGQVKAAQVRLAEAQAEQARKAQTAAEARMASSEANVSEAKAGMGRAQALYDRWESEARRVTGLAQSGVIDASTRDETQNQFKAAAAGREEIHARVASAQAMAREAAAGRDKAIADVASAAAQLDVARAEARRVAALIDYTRIRAPYDGIVTRRYVHTGDFLQIAGGKGGDIFCVAREDLVRVVIDVPEADAALVATGTAAKLSVPALGLVMPCQVSRTSWSLQASSRTLRAEMDIPNSQGKLRPGMYVNAQLQLNLPEGWTVPLVAVAKHGEAMVCFRLEGNKVSRLPVKVGRADSEKIQVLKKQKPGSTDWEDWTGNEILASPASNLSEGQEITP